MTGFESSIHSFLDVAVADKLRDTAQGKQLSQDERNGWWAEYAVFMLCPYDPERSVWKTYFGPLITAQREDGSSVENPSLSEMDEEIILYWEHRADETQHPAMKARYADAVWDLKAKVSNKKPEVRFAAIAIDAYVEAVQKGLSCSRPLNAANHLARALDLAVSISDKQRANLAKQEMLTMLERIGNGNMGAWIVLFDALHAMRKDYMSDEDSERSLAALESVLLRAAQAGSEFDPFAAKAAGERLAKHFLAKGMKSEIDRVTKCWCRAFEFFAKQGGATLGMSYLQTAYEGYRSAGLREEAIAALQSLEATGKGIMKEMKTISEEISIPKDEMDKIVAQFLDDDLERALFGLIHFGMRKSRHAEVLADIDKDNPLQAHIPIELIQDGHVVAHVGSASEDPDGRLMTNMSLLLQGESIILRAVIDEIKAKHGMDSEKIIQFLADKPLFAGIHMGLLREGLDAYFSEDYVKAIHTIVPQIESVLRNMLRLMGIPTLKYSNRTGAMQVKNLNEILAEPRVKKAFGDELEFYLRAVLVDQRCLNVRNNVCHGLLRVEQYGRFMADRVFHSLLCLSYLQETQGPKNTGPAA